MSIVYRDIKGSNLSAPEIDGNFRNLDGRVTTLEDTPTPAVVPVSTSLTGSSLTITYSNGTSFTNTFIIPAPRYKGLWAPDTSYSELDFFFSPDGAFGFVLLDHTSASVFDWDATVDDDPVYRELIAPDGTVVGLAALTDVSITDPADQDMVVYSSGLAVWVNKTPADVTANLSDFVGDSGSGGTKGLVPAPAAGDSAAGKFLAADGTWDLPAGGGGGGATALAGLTDVSIAGPTNLSLLQYLASDGKWHNVPLSSIGGTITGVTAGTGLSGGGTSGSVTIALASVANQRLLANISGGTAAPTATSLTALIDAIAGATRGSVLRRDATAWSILAPGTAGQFLKTGGAGADPSWDTPAGSGTIDEVVAGTGLSGGGTSGSITVALASIADVRVLANISGGSAAPTGVSLTALLDAVLGGNRGQIMYRGASAWLALAPGTSGNVLKTQGVGADPIWGAVKGGGGGGSVGTTTTIWNLSCDLATIAALPVNTYSNGTSGVGATLTATANGALSVDGTAVSVSDRVLVKDESDASHNGVYVVTAAGSGGAHYVLTRATDFDQTAEVLEGSSVYISGGSGNSHTAWVQITGGTITLGSSSIEFEPIIVPLPVSHEGEVLGNPYTYDAPAIPTDLARMLRASLGDGTAGQVITSGGTGVDPTWENSSGGGGFTAVTKTADYTILSGDSGVYFNNDGASANITLSLPPAVPNLEYGAAVHAAHYIELLADGTDKIAVGPDNSASGGFIRSNAPFNSIGLKCHVAGQWVATAFVGSWGIDL